MLSHITQPLKTCSLQISLYFDLLSPSAVPQEHLEDDRILTLVQEQQVFKRGSHIVCEVGSARSVQLAMSAEKVEE